MLTRSYSDIINKLKNIYFRIVRKKLEHMRTDYEEEYLFFMSLLDITLNRDFIINETMESFKERAKYYVHPRLYNELMKVIRPELDAATKI